MQEQMIREFINKTLKNNIESICSLSGGSISSAFKVTFTDHPPLFMKVNHPSDLFFKEAHGLMALAQQNIVRTPKVIDVSKEYLILEFIQQGSYSEGFFKDFGKRLAILHQQKFNTFGFEEDNYIGSTSQKNTPLVSSQETKWSDFFWQNRICFQFKLLEQKKLLNLPLKNAFHRLEKIYPNFFDNITIYPSLLHGDLWSGNFLVDSAGEVVLIDPATYYGHHESDLAMTKLFGGFCSSFYDSYHQIIPKAPYFSERESIYQLYHVLNHANLFGASYLDQAINIINQII